MSVKIVSLCISTLVMAIFAAAAAGAYVTGIASAASLGLFAPAETVNEFEPEPLSSLTVLNEDFEGPTTFVTANSTVNAWVIGTAAKNGGAQGAYISNDSGATNAYTLNVPSINHIYAPIIVPPGRSAIVLSFDWRSVGEYDASTQDFDYLRVSVSSSIPTAGFFPASSAQLPVRYSGQDNYTRAHVNLPASIADGVERYLIFTWRNDASSGTQTPAAIDNVVVTVDFPTPIVGTKSIPGDYSSIGSAFAHLNAHGADTSSGSVVFNVAAGSNFFETPGALTVSGTSPTNRIVFQRFGAGPNPVVTAEGSGNWGRPGIGSVAGRDDAVIALDAADFVTFDGIDVATSSVDSASPFCNIEYGYLLRNNTILSDVVTTNGSQNNIIRNAKITMDRRKSTTIGILQTTNLAFGSGIPATSAATTNSGNRYHNLAIENV